MKPIEEEDHDKISGVDRSQSIKNLSVNNNEIEKPSPAQQKLEKVSDHDEFDDEFDGPEKDGQRSAQQPPENNE